METLSPPVVTSVPATDLPRWNEASTRLTQYLAAHRLASHLHRADLAEEILDEAQARHRERPDAEPVTLTMDVAQERIEKWFAGILEDTASPVGRRVENGRVAIWLTRANDLWPARFAAAELPDDMRRALCESSVRTGPDLAVTSMTSRGVDFGPMETLARQTWQNWDWAALARAGLFWAGVYALGYCLILAWT